jgi:hypothetical protein
MISRSWLACPGLLAAHDRGMAVIVRLAALMLLTMP